MVRQQGFRALQDFEHRGSQGRPAEGHCQEVGYQIIIQTNTQARRACPFRHSLLVPNNNYKERVLYALGEMFVWGDPIAKCPTFNSNIIFWRCTITIVRNHQKIFGTSIQRDKKSSGLFCTIINGDKNGNTRKNY